MMRYRLGVMVRKMDDGGREGSEYPTETRITAECEEHARRLAVGQARAVGLLVSYFTHVNGRLLIGGKKGK